MKIAELRFGMLNWFLITRPARSWRTFVGGRGEVGVIEPMLGSESGVVVNTCL